MIEQTIGGPLPPGFQRAEFLLAHGLVDMVKHRSDLRATLGRLLGVGSAERAAAPADRPDALIREPGHLADKDPWQIVRQARAVGRPTTLDIIRHMLTSFDELHGDRISADCPAIVGGFARLDGIPLIVIGHQKGHTPSELLERNFGMATPGGYRKAARLMRIAAKHRLPILTLIDTPGAYPGVEAEEQGQAAAIAENLRLMSGLPVPTIAVITGEGGSGGALALALSDRVLICENAIYSVISPEGCAAILWRDRAASPQAARALGLDSKSLLRLGIVEGVVREPPGGTQESHPLAARMIGAAVREMLAELRPIEPQRLISERRARFSRFTADVTAYHGRSNDGRVAADW